MAAMTSPSKDTTMVELLDQLRQKYPQLKFTAGQKFYWSPETSEIYYVSGARGQKARWSLLHETGHALLGHSSYEADFELVRLEVAAWQKAKQLAAEFDIKIDENHIEDCLDTYRDWLYRRSICPNCSTKSFQQSDFVHYRCFNCHTIWRVSANRFSRSYRTTKPGIQPLGLPAFF